MKEIAFMILLETESDMNRHIIKHIGVHIYNVLAKPCDKYVIIEGITIKYLFWKSIWHAQTH